jgi:hypothetical protein
MARFNIRLSQVSKAHSEAKPTLCFTLLSAALGHCQLLGYHREKTYSKFSAIQAKRIRRVFWTLYIFDRNLSLLFGRGPLIQDSEIDAGCPTISSDPGLKSWDESFLSFIELARIHGQTYQQLYSVEASICSSTTRLQNANELMAALERWKARLDAVSVEIIADKLYVLTNIHVRWTQLMLTIQPSSISHGNIGSSRISRRSPYKPRPLQQRPKPAVLNTYAV